MITENGLAFSSLKVPFPWYRCVIDALLFWILLSVSSCHQALGPSRGRHSPICSLIQYTALGTSARLCYSCRHLESFDSENLRVTCTSWLGAVPTSRSGNPPNSHLVAKRGIIFSFHSISFHFIINFTEPIHINSHFFPWCINFANSFKFSKWPFFFLVTAFPRQCEITSQLQTEIVTSLTENR